MSIHNLSLFQRNNIKEKRQPGAIRIANAVTICFGFHHYSFSIAGKWSFRNDWSFISQVKLKRKCS